LFRDLVTAIGIELVRHLQHPTQNGTPHYQTTRDLCNNAIACGLRSGTAKDQINQSEAGLCHNPNSAGAVLKTWLRTKGGTVRRKLVEVGRVSN
jgi:hypothetical protein